MRCAGRGLRASATGTVSYTHLDVYKRQLLSQNSTDADALCELLTLSEEQRQYFTGVLPGQGLMKIGSAYVPFDGRIPAGGDLYRLYSTTFQEGK